MLAQVKQETKHSACLFESESVEKGHGRIESRNYQIYQIESIYQDQRWDECQIRTAIKVSRERLEIKSGKVSVETNYYLSNQSSDWQELCVAVRKHWSVETNNHIRDVTLREDQMRSKKRMSTEF